MAPNQPYTFTVSGDDMPAPGETVEITIDDYVILLENTKQVEVDEIPAYGEIVSYTPVETVHSSTKRHAAAVRQRNIRTHVDPYTLCSRSGTRRVKRRLRGEPLTNVTCIQCRAILSEEGEV